MRNDSHLARPARWPATLPYPGMDEHAPFDHLGPMRDRLPTPGCWICDPDAIYNGEEACSACFADALDHPIVGDDEGLPLNTAATEGIDA